ncbi:MAG: general stress protein, partial [Methylocaldum sp.]|nr:general stress protein [Methylocaldum sp.]
MINTVVGLLDNRSEAEKVVHDLEREGFGRDHIHVMTSDVEYERELGAAGGAQKESGLRFVLSKLGLLEERRHEIGLPAEDIRYYSEGVRRGGLLVTVETDESHADRAAQILEEHGAVNI